MPYIQRARLILASRPSYPFVSTNPEPPIQISEQLLMVPGDCETYFVPLTTTATVTVSVNAQAPFHIRLLDEETWSCAGTPAARLTADSRYSGFFDSFAVVRFRALDPGSFMILICNAAATTNKLCLTLGSKMAHEGWHVRKCGPQLENRSASGSTA